MKRNSILILLVLLTGSLLFLNDCIHKKQEQKAEQEVGTDVLASNAEQKFNILTEQEQKDGWTLLFDGKSLDHWRGYKMDSVPANWVVEDQCLVTLGKGGDAFGDIITREKFDNFDLKIEWKLSPAGNSGIFYHVVEGDEYPTVYATGPEYQLIDDLGYPEKLEDWQTTGANYGLNPPQNPKLKPAGEWNSSEIVVNGAHVIHYLNGEKVVEFDMWTDEWKEAVSHSKWKDYPGYGLAKTGYIGLQDHGSKIWFRNIKIKKL